MKLVVIAAGLAAVLTAATAPQDLSLPGPSRSGLSLSGAQSPPSAPSAQPAADVDIPTRVTRLEQRAARLESALQRSDVAIEALSKQVKLLTDAQALFARGIEVDPTGSVRIVNNLRADRNVLEDTITVDCDTESTVGTKRRCTCPDGSVATGIELRPIAVSATPGPSTYNTVLMCSKL